jgi:hypothetical protein
VTASCLPTPSPPLVVSYAVRDSRNNPGSTNYTYFFNVCANVNYLYYPDCAATVPGAGGCPWVWLGWVGCRVRQRELPVLPRLRRHRARRGWVSLGVGVRVGVVGLSCRTASLVSRGCAGSPFPLVNTSSPAFQYANFPVPTGDKCHRLGGPVAPTTMSWGLYGACAKAGWWWCGGGGWFLMWDVCVCLRRHHQPEQGRVAAVHGRRPLPADQPVPLPEGVAAVLQRRHQHPR